MKKFSLFVIFLLKLSLIWAQADSVLAQIENPTVIKSDRYKIISIKNYIDTNTYCKIKFDIQPEIYNDKKGIEKISFRYLVDDFKLKHSEALKNQIINVSLDNLDIIFSSPYGFDTVFSYLNKIFSINDIDKKLFDEIKNDEIKQSFPPFISPNLYITNKTKTALYGTQHPQGEDIFIDKMKNISLNDFKKFYNENILKSFVYIFIMSDKNIDYQKVDFGIYFKLSEQISEKKQNFKSPQMPPNTVIYFHETDEKIIGDKTYMNILYPLKSAIGSKNYEKEIIIDKILGEFKTGRLYTKLKSDDNLTDYVFLRHDISPENPELAVSVVLNPEYLAEILQIIISEQAKIIEETIPEAELEIAKEMVMRDFEKKLNSFDKISEMLYYADKYKFPKQYFSELPLKISQVTADDIKNYAKDYLRTDKYTIVVLGKNNLLENQFLKLADNAETRSYVDNKNVNVIPFGFGAPDIIKTYLKNVGSEKYPPENIQEINVEGKYFFDDFEKEYTRKIVRSGRKYLSEIYLKTDSAEKVLIRKDIVNSKKTIAVNNTDTIISENNKSNFLYTESFQHNEWEYFENDSIKIQLLGIIYEPEREMYKILVQYPYEKYLYEYYDKYTFLKLKTEELKKESTKEGNNFKIIRTIEISDYRKVAGTKNTLIPYTKIVTAPQYKIIMNIVSVNFNAKINSSVFDLK